MTIITLTDQSVARLSHGPTHIVRDRVLCGLCIKIGARTKTFLVATSARGKQVRITLGRWPLMNVDDARSAALPLLRQCRAGQVPFARVAPELPSVVKVLAEYIEAKQIKVSSAKRYESLLRTHFPEWTDRPVSDLALPAFDEHCLGLTKTMGAAGVSLARALVGSMLRYIGAVYRLEISDPFARFSAAGFMPGKAKPRDRKLQDDQLRDWWRSVDQLPSVSRDYLRLVLLTGLRKSEAANLLRADIDWKASTITFSATKNGKTHVLPITSHLREILERRCADIGVDDRLFGGVSAGHLHSVAMRGGAPAFSLHDLRKLFATTGARSDIDDTTLRKLLNHSVPSSDVLNQHYVKLMPSDLLKPLMKIQDALIALATGEHPQSRVDLSIINK